jgi:hypothetical protein
MQKKQFNFFNFLRDIVHFVKIIILVILFLLILYWIQDLIGVIWKWFRPLLGFFNCFLDICEGISSNSLQIINTTFDYKYLVAIAILMVFYIITHLVYISIDSFENLYIDCSELVRKIKENRFNRKLRKEQILNEKKINHYKVFIQIQIKSEHLHEEHKTNLDEQNQILIEHLIKKTKVYPKKFEDGYLFSFETFNQVDLILNIFSKILKSNAPVDYIICIQTVDEVNNYKEQLKSLINLKILNKIIAMSDTIYRYKFNETKEFETIALGVYQKGLTNFSVYEFINKN